MDECIDAYLDLSKEVFNVDKVLAGHIPVGDDRCRFDYNILERVIKQIIQQKLGDENCRMNAIPKTANKTCPTFVVAKTAANINSPPTIFRTYRGDKTRPSECALWQAARATSAAPTFFKPMTIDRPRPAITYVDGGMGYNNPSELALNEARRIWPTCTQFGLVSIGTGRPKANAIQLSEAAEANPDVQRSIMEDIKSYLPNIVIQRLEYSKKFNARGESTNRNGQRFGTTCDQFRGCTSARSTRFSIIQRRNNFLIFDLTSREMLAILGWEIGTRVVNWQHTQRIICRSTRLRKKGALCVKFLLSASSSRK